MIFRTSWVYATRGTNFAKTMLRLATERDHLNVIDDQIGAPTGADLIADVTAQAVRACHQQREKQEGVYHLVSSGQASWYDYATFVIDFARQAGIPLTVATKSILPVPSREFPSPAQRPHNSRMDTAKIKQAFGLVLPTWQTGVARMLTELLGK
jgi:dTDP-4-dehydrorhamnose reductase